MRCESSEASAASAQEARGVRPASAASTARIPGHFTGSNSRIRAQWRSSAPLRPSHLALRTSPIRSLSPSDRPILPLHAVGSLRCMCGSRERPALHKRAAQTLSLFHVAVVASQDPKYPVGFCSPSARGPSPFTSPSSTSAVTAIQQAVASVRISLSPVLVGPRKA